MQVSLYLMTAEVFSGPNVNTLCAANISVLLVENDCIHSSFLFLLHCVYRIRKHKGSHQNTGMQCRSGKVVLCPAPLGTEHP